MFFVQCWNNILMNEFLFCEKKLMNFFIWQKSFEEFWVLIIFGTGKYLNIVKKNNNDAETKYKLKWMSVDDLL